MVLLMEIWKDVENYEGLYQVSNLGNIKSLKRIVKHKNGNQHTVHEKILRPIIDRDGYLRVSLAVEGLRPVFQIHRIVMLMFTGPSELQVNHIDGDRTNNRLSNLEYVTNISNINHRELKLNGKKRYGVYKLGEKWRIIISINNKRVSLGVHECKETAYITFYNAYLNYYGVEPWKGELNETL